MKMTVDELQKQIHVLYEGDVDAPANTSDEDYQIRLRLINQAIAEWEAVPNVLWRELVDIVTTTCDTDEADITVNLPEDFARMYDGVITIGNLHVPEVPLELVAAKIGEDSITPFFYVVGNNSDGFEANFIHLDPHEGETITYTYIKQARQMNAPTDVPEVPDPTYIIHRVVAELYAQDSDPKSTRELSISQSLLEQMITRNALISINGDNTYERS